MFDYADAPETFAGAIREDIKAAHRRFWERLAQPGCWWNGAERVAIARESRNALGEADSDTDGSLPPRAIDAAHTIILNQASISRAWVEDNAANGLSKEAYVELVGIVVAVFSIDEFHRALGLPLEPLPVPVPGNPSGYRPAHLAEDIGFVPTVPPDGAVGNEADLWQQGRTANVVRALTLVPDALRDWRDLGGAQYLSFEAMGNFVGLPDRTLNRMQAELIAGRVSAVNECFY